MLDLLTKGRGTSIVVAVGALDKKWFRELSQPCLPVFKIARET